MQTIEAKAILSAADKTGGVFSRIAAKIQGMNAAAAAGNRSVGRTAMIAGSATRAAERANGAIIAGAGRVLAPAAAAGFAAKSYANFAKTDLAIKRIGITADGSEEQVAGLAKGIKDLAFATGKPSQEVTKGLESLVAGGMNLPEALPALPAIVKTAQAAGAEVEDMSTTTLALNQNLGIATDKMQNAFDILVKGGKAGKFELKDMARYFPSIAPAAVAAGMKGEEGLMRIVAALQTIRAGTGTTEEAASSMQNVFAKMESEETAKKFAKFGIDLRKEMAKARKEGKDLLEVFTDLSQQATKGDLSKIPQLFSDMEMARAMRGLLSFRDLNKKVMAELRQSAGSTERDFAKVINTPAIAIERMKESWDRLMYSIGHGMDTLSKKMGGSGGFTQGMNDAAARIEAITEKGVGGAVEDFNKELRDVAHDREVINLMAAVERQQALAEKARARGDTIAPHRVEQMINNQARLYQLQNERGGPLFTADEVKRFQEAPLAPGSFPLPSADPRKGRVPMPSADPRGSHAPSETPPVQELNVEVKGQAEVTVKFLPGSDLIRLEQDVKRALATLSSNGPGSTGKSSPDAQPGNVGSGGL